VLAGEQALLREAVKLCLFDRENRQAKSVRAGAAKIVEIVAEKKPAWVAADLELLLPALDVPEPQTRWMVIRAFGFCAKANPQGAAKALPYAESFIQNKKDGMILPSSAALYLGDLGAVSPELARQAFPILLSSSSSILANELDWILEALIALADQLGDPEKRQIESQVLRDLDVSKAATLKRIKKLRKKLGASE
jgi:hypothetical protein